MLESRVDWLRLNRCAEVDAPGVVSRVELEDQCSVLSLVDAGRFFGCDSEVNGPDAVPTLEVEKLPSREDVRQRQDSVAGTGDLRSVVVENDQARRVRSVACLICGHVAIGSRLRSRRALILVNSRIRLVRSSRCACSLLLVVCDQCELWSG